MGDFDFDYGDCTNREIPIYIELHVYITKETPKAIMFLSDNLEAVWLPKSQITICTPEENGKQTIEVPEWLLLEKNLEGDSCVS